ncbi:hypothetical protein JCM8115_006841 [Rhodotorula mucilaginosa]
MDVSAPATPAQPHRLSKLPTELLDMIFDDAWAKQRPSGPINRALCPFYDRFAWRSIRIDSPARLARFFELTDKRTHLGQLCEELLVQLHPAELDRATLTGLLGRTPNLKKLVLADLASEVFEHVLNGTKSSLLPRHLRKLDLWCTTGDRKDPYHPTNWLLLNDLKSLNQLALDLRSTGTPIGLIKSKNELPTWSGITDLEIGLPQKGRSSVLQLIACFPNLRRLQLSSTSSVPDFAGPLAALQDPGSLQALVLIGNPKKGWTVPDEIEQLTSLRDLKLVGHWQHLPSTDFDRIGDLPLRRFELGPKSDLPLELFLSAVLRHGCPTLEAVHFDNLTSRVGYKVKKRDLPFTSEGKIRKIRKSLRTWRNGKWTKTFSAVLFEEVVHECQHRNISVSGTSLQALYVDDHVALMEDRINELHGMIRARQWRHTAYSDSRSSSADEQDFDWKSDDDTDSNAGTDSDSTVEDTSSSSQDDADRSSEDDADLSD